MHQRISSITASLAALAAVTVLAAPPIRHGGDHEEGTTDWGSPNSCALDAPTPTVVDGGFTLAEAKTYRMVPFTVPKGTTRVEVGYSWDDVEPKPANSRDGSTVDLGLWDNHGYRAYEGFRGWSGSRQGKIAKGMEPVWVQAENAERGYRPGPIEPGTWYVELGAGGIATNGATYHLEIACYSPKLRPDAPANGKAPKLDPVDPTHVANANAGWYYGDFHLHAYHSSPKGLAGPEMAAAAKAKGIDIVPVTEYVTNAHWDQLGATQRANPDMLIWPSREIITYFGHSITYGETRNTIEYRQGFEDVTLADIQKSAKADGALFSVAHPTAFPGAELANFCRGCNFQLGDSIDWDRVDTMEIHTSDITNSPFTKTAIELWDQKLHEGHKITGLSGADDKSGDKYGATVTAVYADQLSRPAVTKALLAGHAYVMVRGRYASPTLTMTATGADGGTGIFGDTLVTETADAKVTIAGAKGQALQVVRNGVVVETRPIDADPYSATIAMTRDAASDGPLGTYWRIQTLDGENFTSVGNPIFLNDHQPKLHTVTATTSVTSTAASTSNNGAASRPSTPDSRSTDTTAKGSNEDTLLIWGALAALIAGGGGLFAFRRMKSTTDDTQG